MQIKPKKLDYLKTLSDDDKKITLTNLTSTLEYNDIYKDVDLEYEVRPDDVKETIVLNKKIDNTYFEFNINVKSLTAKLQADKSIIFYDAKDLSKEVFIIDAPYMIDAKEKESKDIVVGLTQTKNGYILSLMPNKEWLDSSERVYPIKIDPTVTTALGAESIQDTFVTSSQPTTNNYLSTLLKTGYQATTGNIRTYMKFSLPTLTSADMAIKAHGVTTSYHLVGDKVTYETKGTDTTYYTYDGSNNLVSMNLNGVEYYYIRNAQEDIIGLFDKTGVQVVSYTYDTWGKLISTTGSLASTIGVKNPYRYRGYRYDTETGLYYLHSRYYNADWGRFINADDTDILTQQHELLGKNLFAYCRNNPIMFEDSSGYDQEDIGRTRKATPALRGIAIAAAIGVSAAGGMWLLEAGIYKRLSSVNSTGKVPKKVIRHYPAYVKMSNKLGTKPFSVPLVVWNKMNKAQQWSANKKFLDRAIAKGSEFVLATPINKVRPGSFLQDEINYLLLNGYKLSNNGSKLVK